MGLIQFLKTNENARKIFGQRELKIIEKQLFGMQLKQSEKNRLSRDIRKKLDFIKEISKFQNEFSLKHGAQIKSLIEDVKETILESKWRKRIKKIYLFGSIISKEHNLSSDIDIAVEFNAIDLTEATEFRIYISGRVSSKIDIQVYNILPEKIKKSIDKEKRIIYEG